MKRFVSSLVLFSMASGLVHAQQKPVEQSGVPARLVTTTGKEANVFLQKVEGEKLTFQPNKSAKNMAAPIDKIERLAFSMSKEEFDLFREQSVVSEEKILEIYNTPEISKLEKLGLIFEAVLAKVESGFLGGDLDTSVSLVEPIMQERGAYMAIDNNLQDLFVMLMEAYRRQGQLDKMRACAATLKDSSESLMVQKAQVNLALAALAEDNIADAEKVLAEIDSDVVKLYLQACIDRAKGEPKQAFRIVTGIIAEHGNDVNWLPPTELLSAQLYLDLNMTNSAVLTARQVKNMYAGTMISADAELFRTGLVDTTEESE